MEQEEIQEQIAEAERQQEERLQRIRMARNDSIAEAAGNLCMMLASLGPCFAVTVCVTLPGETRGQMENVTKTVFSNEEVGAGHYASLSDLMNQKHVELQKRLDREALEEAGKTNGDGPPKEASS